MKSTVAIFISTLLLPVFSATALLLDSSFEQSPAVKKTVFRRRGGQVGWATPYSSNGWQTATHFLRKKIGLNKDIS